MILGTSRANAARSRSVLTMRRGAICSGRNKRSETTRNPKRLPTSATRRRNAAGEGFGNRCSSASRSSASPPPVSPPAAPVSEGPPAAQKSSRSAPKASVVSPVGDSACEDFVGCEPRCRARVVRGACARGMDDRTELFGAGRAPVDVHGERDRVDVAPVAEAGEEADGRSPPVESDEPSAPVCGSARTAARRDGFPSGRTGLSTSAVRSAGTSARSPATVACPQGLRSARSAKRCGRARRRSRSLL